MAAWTEILNSILCAVVSRLDLGDSQIGLTQTISKECWITQDRNGSNPTMVLVAHLTAKTQMALLHHPPYEMLPQHMTCSECAENKGLKWLRVELSIICQSLGSCCSV